MLAVSVNGWTAAAQTSGSAQALVDKLVLADTIQPVTAGELDRALAQANADGAQALLMELDTPGGLLDSTRAMAGAIAQLASSGDCVCLSRRRARRLGRLLSP